MPPRKKQKVEHSGTSDSVVALPQRTTRAMAKAALVPTSGQPSQPPAASCAKKGGATRVVGRPRKGHLMTLPEIAVELQLEIYSYLDLKDLHNMSRTCTRFRKFFLGRKTVTKERLWVQARANTDDFPERPPFLSEPAFVHLLLSPQCHRCGCSNVHNVIWRWFTRYCSKCFREVTVSWKEAEDYARTRDRNNILTYREPFLLVNVINPSTRYNHKDSCTYNRIHRDHLDKLLTEWLDVCPSNTQWDASRKISREFEEKRAAESAVRNEYARVCEEWFDKQQDKRWALLNAARTARFNEIVNRLRDGGWDKEIAFMGRTGLEEMATIPVVRQAAKLTPKAWQDVYERLEGHLNDIRKERIAAERRALLESRLELFDEVIRDFYVRLPRSASMEYRARGADLAFIDECQSLLDAPNERLVTQADIEAILPDVVARWEAEQKEKLSTMVKNALPEPVPDDVDALTLAVAMFGCLCFGQDFRWHRTPGEGEFAPPRFPAILGHDCIRRDYWRYNAHKESEYAHIVLKLSSSATARRPFKVENIIHTPGVVSEASIVLKTLGFDPLRTTVDDLKDCNARLRCLSCSQNYAGYAFTWETAINHACSYVGASPRHNKWALIEGEEELELVRRLEAEVHDVAYTSKAAREDVFWSCSLCLAVDEKWPRMQEHYKSEHPDEDAESCLQNGTIYRHPFKSCKVQLKPPVQFISPSPPGATMNGGV
ncbi:hypothetical protein GY45DRAFT_1360059 [Cubamyces sp. BRFM 1775]|nr:hypothetical protein GY45DRAFT_1360059 [Cubamyces sp. BRFM 1775]